MPPCVIRTRGQGTWGWALGGSLEKDLKQVSEGHAHIWGWGHQRAGAACAKALRVGHASGIMNCLGCRWSQSRVSPAGQAVC